VTLIYGILRFSNFAHGDTMAFGAMVTILVTWGLQSAGVTLGPLAHGALALPVGIAATGFWCSAPTGGLRFYRSRRPSRSSSSSPPSG
jgi:branched-chain amino acid transport system permease protein